MEIKNSKRELEEVKQIFKGFVAEDRGDHILVVTSEPLSETVRAQLIKNNYSYQEHQGFVEVYSNRVRLLYDLSESMLNKYIESDEDEKSLRVDLDAQDVSFDTLCNMFHSLTGGEVIDNRCDKSHEYTGVNLQRDEEFYQDTTNFEL